MRPNPLIATLTVIFLSLGVGGRRSIPQLHNGGLPKNPAVDGLDLSPPD
jgi:hypothetical protein